MVWEDGGREPPSYPIRAPGMARSAVTGADPNLEGIQAVTRPSILRLALPGILLFLVVQGVLWTNRLVRPFG